MQRVERDGDEQQREIHVRPVEQPHRAHVGELVAAPGALPHQVGLDQEAGPEHGGDDRVEQMPVSATGHSASETAHHHPRVGDDLAGHALGVLDHRQHRHVDAGVVLAVAHRQRPGVRRRPEEHDQEQHDRRPGELVGDGGPADQRREAAGEAAPHDVLRRTPLEHHRVAEEVERARRERQPGREPVDQEARAPASRPRPAPARRPGPPAG